MISLKKRKFCCTCGSQMVRFRYPGRWRCPRPKLHPAIEAEKNRRGSPKGRKSVTSMANLEKAWAARMK